jgi:rod shape-determining protein MreD
VVSLPLAAAGAVLAALLETSVFSELRPFGVKPDLVFVFAIITAMVVGVEDGLIWAFLGGLMLDLLSAERPIGATTLALLLVTGIAIAVARFLPQTRVLMPTLAVFVLAWVYHFVGFGLLAATTRVSIPPDPGSMILPVSLVDAGLGLIVALVARSLWLRYSQHDRLEW